MTVPGRSDCRLRLGCAPNARPYLSRTAAFVVSVGAVVFVACLAGSVGAGLLFAVISTRRCPPTGTFCKETATD